MTPALLLFARFPTPGRVKTRLARTTGDAFAAAWYRRCAERVLGSLAEVSATRLAFVADPADADRMQAWVGPAWQVRPQVPGDLTARLNAAFEEAHRLGSSPIVVTATDTPGLTGARVAQALRALADHDAVLGPATDGGYYLLGLRSPEPAVFEGIAWSTGLVADQTRARLRDAGLSWAELDPLADVDTEQDLAAFVEDHPDDPLARWVRVQNVSTRCFQRTPPSDG